ncbi:hypothetical protein Q8A67_007136 [Cirrhinus molitorella]|uniref:Ig-like domain-containing protein n=1 Tax=Cirrhinus molitorella TaxID=172907 RepID=A0AA88TV75_9TELE|nr:hypothetical protein Q8A67_007136 [Cirrhinus molitorella]
MLQNLTLTLLINLTFMFSTGKFVSSCLYKEVGDKAVIPFGEENLEKYYELRWSHNERRGYYKRGLHIKLNEFKVDQNGSLILENVQKDKSGEYKGIAYNENGSLINSIVHQLCVQEPVSEPMVIVMCVEKGVNLTCKPMNNESTVVSWMKNGMNANATDAILQVSSSELNSGDKFSCTVSNNVKQKSAKDVEPVCSDTDEDMMDVWWMLVILTAGGCFLLILFIICLVCVWRCRQNKRKAKKEEEYRLATLMPDHTNQPDEPYMQQTTSQKASKSQRPLPPLPTPQGPPYFGPLKERNL